MFNDMQHIYSPEKIKSFIDYNYVSSGDMVQIKNMFPIVPFYNYFKGIPNIDICKIVWFVYDLSGQWCAYRNCPDPKFIIDNEYCLQNFSTKHNYLCYITDESVEILFTKSIIDDTIEVLTHNFINHNTIINNAGYVTSDGRILLLNSTNPIDLIFSYLRFGHSREVLSELLSVMATDEYYIGVEKCLNYLSSDLKKLCETPPIKNYTNMFKLSMSHDINYHLIGYDKFHKHVIDIIHKFSSNYQETMFKNMFSFFRNLRNDIVIELVQLYNRFRNYPHERIAIYKIHSAHPMLQLVRYIHHMAKQTNTSVTYEFISYLINDNSNVNIYDHFGCLLMNAIAYRSDLFVDLFKEFISTQNNNISPKYKNYQNYYPFRRYSSTLFIIEHLLKMYI